MSVAQARFSSGAFSWIGTVSVSKPRVFITRNTRPIVQRRRYKSTPLCASARFSTVRVVNSRQCNSRQCSGVSPDAGSVSRASSRVSSTPAGNAAVRRARLRFGRWMLTRRARRLVVS
jgi:hypothetical protein